MCLSTAYFGEKCEEQIAARYVSKVNVAGEKVILTDIMGIETEIIGKISFIDLTGGVVIIESDVA